MYSDLVGSRLWRARLLAVTVFGLLLLSSGCNRHAFSSYGDGEYSWSHGARRVNVKALGDVEFTAEDDDVARLSSDGYLMIEETVGWDSRIIEFSPGSNGQVQKRLLVEGKEQAFDAESHAWLRRILPEVLRRTGLAAETRARRIIETGGYRAFADELERIPSSSAAARYVEVAFAMDVFTEEEQADLLSALPRYVHSDSQRTRLLRQVSARASSETMREPYFEAVDSIGSNSNRAYLLTGLLAEMDPEPAFVTRLLKSAGRIGSDSNKAHVLVEAAPRLPPDPAAHFAFLDAAKSIGSDSNKTHVLEALLPAAGQRPELLAAMFEASHTIGSDSSKSSFLSMAAKHAVDVRVREAFFAASETIGSNSNRLHVLSSVLSSAEVDGPTLGRLYRAGASIGSDSNKSDLLIRSLPAYRNDSETRQGFFAMADTIGSSSNRASVFLAMLDLPSLDAETILALIDSTQTIGSDSQKADVLAHVAQRRDSDPRIAPRLRQAARTIGSDSAYRRVTSELQPEREGSQGEG